MLAYGANAVIDAISVKTVSSGSKGKSVTILQEALLEIGRGLNIKNTGGADGGFGAGTKKDLEEFQAIFGLNPDGVAGEKTWGTLAKSQNVQRGGSFPPLPLVAYTVSGSGISLSPTLKTPTTAIDTKKKATWQWAFIPIGVAIIGIIAAIMMRKRKGKKR
jgi:peptidoglycan hydrolase-like protein with peptidoglycan-binding domain